MPVFIQSKDLPAFRKIRIGEISVKDFIRSKEAGNLRNIFTLHHAQVLQTRRHSLLIVLQFSDPVALCTNISRRLGDDITQLLCIIIQRIRPQLIRHEGPRRNLAL